MLRRKSLGIHLRLWVGDVRLCGTAPHREWSRDRSTRRGLVPRMTGPCLTARWAAVALTDLALRPWALTSTWCAPGFRSGTRSLERSSSRLRDTRTWCTPSLSTTRSETRCAPPPAREEHGSLRRALPRGSCAAACSVMARDWTVDGAPAALAHANVTKAIHTAAFHQRSFRDARARAGEA